MLETKESNEFEDDGEELQESCVEELLPKKNKFGKKKHTYNCLYDDCNKSYSTSTHLRRHEATHENTSYRCTEKDCEGIFKTKFTLKRHVDNFHLGKKPKKYKCPECDQEFNKHNWLKRHQYRHTGESPFVCSFAGCGKSFLFPSRLKKHLKVHEGYTCSKENCDQKFYTWTSYVKHVKTAHPTVHKCQFCGKQFSRSTYLKDHLESHKLDRKVYLCPKENCSKFYFRNRGLTYHLKSYHEKRVFECTVKNCSKTFKSQEDLNVHVNHHDSKKRPRRKKKGKVKPSFAAKLAGLVPKTISSSSKAIDHETPDKLSEDKNKNTSSPEILVTAYRETANDTGHRKLVSSVESDKKNEDTSRMKTAAISDMQTISESNVNIKETLLNSKLMCPQNSLRCISA